MQEVIVQNFRAKPDTAMRHADDLGLDEYRAAIAVTRLVLGPRARVQAPPNLVDQAQCRALLEAGVDDWGGVSPLTPEYVRQGEPRPDPQVSAHVAALATADGLARPCVHPTGLPWQEPDGGLVSAGRTDLHESVDTEGRTEDRRSAIKFA